MVIVAVSGCDSTSVHDLKDRRVNPEMPMYEFINLPVMIQANYQKTVSISGITRDTLENSVWFVYLSNYDLFLK